MMRRELCAVARWLGPAQDSSDHLPNAVDLGYSRWCAQPVRADSFCDALSQRECTITAVCQRCQDRCFLGGSDRDPPISAPVRDGIVVGVVLEGASLCEVALLPFQFVARWGCIEWEPRHIVRVGDRLTRLDPWVELGAMRDAWAEHYLRILTLVSFSDPLLSVRLSTSELVVGLDRACLEVIGHSISSLTQRPLADLPADVPWRDAFGVPLLPLHAFLRAHGLDGAVGTGAACAGSALPQCALVARLFELRATAATDGGCTAFELLLQSHAGRFEPSLPGDSDAGA